MEYARTKLENMDSNENGVNSDSRLRNLYPNVTEPLPLCWSSTEVSSLLNPVCSY